MRVREAIATIAEWLWNHENEIDDSMFRTWAQLAELIMSKTRNDE